MFSPILQSLDFLGSIGTWIPFMDILEALAVATIPDLSISPSLGECFPLSILVSQRKRSPWWTHVSRTKRLPNQLWFHWWNCSYDQLRSHDQFSCRCLRRSHGWFGKHDHGRFCKQFGSLDNFVPTVRPFAGVRLGPAVMVPMTLVSRTSVIFCP